MDLAATSRQRGEREDKKRRNRGIYPLIGNGAVPLSPQLRFIKGVSSYPFGCMQHDVLSTEIRDHVPLMSQDDATQNDSVIGIKSCSWNWKIMHTKSWILTKFTPEKIYFLQRLKKKMLILTKNYYVKLWKYSPVKLAMAKPRH